MSAAGRSPGDGRRNVPEAPPVFAAEALAGVPGGGAAAMPVNPAAAFYASPLARLAGSALRAAHRWSPRVATRLALGLFFTPLPSKQHARAKPVPAPWVASSRRFEAGELVTWQRSDVRPGAPRVLLVHGWAGDAQQWRALGDRLAAAGFDPVLLDLPAHGRSDGRRSTLPQWVRALFAVTAPLGPWHAVVAHSLGALASAHAAARGLPAARLALVATSPPPRLFLRWFAAGLGPGEALAQRMQQRIEHREGVPLAQFEPAWLGRHLQQPTLLVHDADDRTAPLAGAERLAAALPRAELALSRGLGHRRILADEQVLQRLVQFVAV
ncbi:MAG: alpha/beta fold hydrolase [Burkholderiales bacterium]|nr:alpha/beta fold hydrolase [Burkholderiales bacterium]